MNKTIFLSRMAGRTFYRRGIGKPAVLRRSFLFGFPGHKSTTHVIYYEEGNTHPYMVTAGQFCDMFSETPMVPETAPQTTKAERIAADKARKDRLRERNDKMTEAALGSTGSDHY